MTKHQTRELTSSEQASIAAFAAHFGRSWKAKLAEVFWYNARVWIDRTGTQHNGLHALRNDPFWGHDGLQAYRLPR